MTLKAYKVFLLVLLISILYSSFSFAQQNGANQSLEVLWINGVGESSDHSIYKLSTSETGTIEYPTQLPTPKQVFGLVDGGNDGLTISSHANLVMENSGNKSIWIPFNHTGVANAQNLLVDSAGGMMYQFKLLSGNIRFQLNGEAKFNYAPQTNAWTSYLITYNEQTNNATLYVNCDNVDSTIDASMVVKGTGDTRLGNEIGSGGGREAEGNFAGFRLYNYTLTEDDCDLLYDNGNFPNSSLNDLGGGKSIPEVGVESQLTVQAIDLYDRATVNNFTVFMSNSTATLTNTTENGELKFGGLINLTTYTVNITSNDSGGYFNNTAQVFVNLSSTHVFSIYQSELVVNATEIISKAIITDFNISVPLQFNQSNGSGFAALLLRQGTYTVEGATADHLNTTDSVTLAPLTRTTLTLEFGTGQFNITAKEFFVDTVIDDFSIVIGSREFDNIQVRNSTSGFVAINLINGNYSLNVSASGFVTRNHNVTFTGEQNLTSVLFADNSIFLRVFDETTGLLIDYSNVSVRLAAPLIPVSLNFTSTNGTFNEKGFVSGTYDLRISSLDGVYPTRQFIVSFSAGSHVSLDAYLLNSSDATDIEFFVRDPTDKLVEGANLLVTTQINNSFVTIGQDTTDFAGRVVFPLKTTTQYTVQINADSFNTKIITVTPGSDTTFTIYLSDIATVEFTNFFNLIDFARVPSPGVLGSILTNLTFVINSPTAILEWFGLQGNFSDNLSVQAISNLSASPGGGTALLTFNLTNATGRTVNIVYFIKAQGFDTFRINSTFYVGTVGTVQPDTSLAGISRDTRAGLSALTQAAIAVFIAAIAAMVLTGFGIPGVASGFAGLFVLLGFAIFGWINIAIASILIVVAVIVYFSLTKGEATT